MKEGKTGEITFNVPFFFLSFMLRVPLFTTDGNLWKRLQNDVPIVMKSSG